jgi:protein-tyrosine phosphatase
VNLLFVCHANVCRSPMAERLAKRHFEPTVNVASAGTHAYDGAPLHPNAARVLAELGADAEGFTSRPLTASLLATADLVLTATREQRAACVTLLPEALPRTFTLRQFGRLAAACEPPQHGEPAQHRGLEARVDAARAARSRLQPVDPRDDDLADPVRQPLDAFRRCAAEIQDALRAITAS